MVSLLILWNTVSICIYWLRISVYATSMYTVLSFVCHFVLITVMIKTSDIPHLMDSRWGYRKCTVE